MGHRLPDDIRDDDAWHVDPLPQVVTSHVRDALPHPDRFPGLTPLFDVGHEETARFYGTARGFTGCFTDERYVQELPAEIPMGYTNLDLYEKAAVADRGALVRAWRPRYARHPGTRAYTLVVPGDAAHDELTLMSAWPLRHAIDDAKGLSARLQVPVLVARLLRSTTWH
ncbi:hypothetical protein [Georgenia sp. SUBG003]|uniref:hypothetical protein n=1 Tax=Georgenia sp. SUBG003 TaxID=1497974 RepID=UPI0004D5F857|nr:hypothetical protein DA06_10090 [Georgenia sp. SUBG003]